MSIAATERSVLSITQHTVCVVFASREKLKLLNYLGSLTGGAYVTVTILAEPSGDHIWVRF
jgi:hypothetical protein